MREPLMQLAMIRYLLADGGVSSALWAAGAGRAEPVELLNLGDPALVSQVHQAFRDAGANCITTNTFGALRAAAASGVDVGEICRAGVGLARKVAANDNYVLGSLGLPPDEDPLTAAPAWTSAAAALASDADGIILETVSSTQHLGAALRLTREAAPNLPVIVSLAFNRQGNGSFMLSSSGEILDAAIAAVVAAAPDAIGANCGAGVDGYDMSTIIAAMRGRFDGPIIARPSAGTPSETASGLEYPAGPDMMTDAIWGLVRAGANIIGGCCGVSPDHIAAFRTEMDML